MGIRQWMDERPKLAITIGCVVVVAAIVAVVVEIMANRRGYPTAVLQAYFTSDDGQTYFADRSDRIPPFDHNGQPAVRAYVYKCGDKIFVGYMERFTTEAHDAIVGGKPVINYLRYGRELKRPGDAKWVKSGDLATESKISEVPCPDGHGTPDIVDP